MERLKIKVKHTRAGIIADALVQYAELSVLMFSGETENKENYEIRFSIAIQLHYVFKKKFEARYPPQTHLVALELHEAIVLQTALLYFINCEKNDFRRNEMEIVKNELHKKRTDLRKTVTP
jgi:hypothetical protein